VSFHASGKDINFKGVLCKKLFFLTSQISHFHISFTEFQPYASYLVAGIKIHEGRTWYSSHRGRLWIHAASKQPTEQEVEDLQTFYRHIYGGRM